MVARVMLLSVCVVACAVLSSAPDRARGCCAIAKSGKPVVNADQTVIIIWDAATKTQHFIRKASFKTDAEDLGFLVPSPTQPELSESGNEAFPVLLKLTEPEKQTRARPSRGMSCGCGKTKSKTMATDNSVRVLEQKVVAGFKASVLEADSADALVGWLKQHGYIYSPAVRDWAKPYVDKGWKITALKVAKDKNGKSSNQVTASALRMSFKTARPMFPYREPASSKAAETLGARDRLLRIYFLADARYKGEFPNGAAWSGDVAWTNRIGAADRRKILQHLKLPDTTGPKDWWLTEFEDRWEYAAAPGDVYFSRDDDQSPVRRDPIIIYTSSLWPTDVTVYGFIAIALLIPLRIWSRRRQSGG